MAGAPPPPGPKRQARLVFADDDDAELVEFRRNVKRRGPGAKTLVARAGKAVQGRFMDTFFKRRDDDDYAGTMGAGAGAGAGCYTAPSHRCPAALSPVWKPCVI